MCCEQVWIQLVDWDALIGAYFGNGIGGSGTQF